jgi:hypothetical protein
VKTLNRAVRTTGIVGALVGLCVAAAPASASTAGVPASPGRPGHGPYTFAVIGDIPYGDAQIARFPSVVQQINADPAVQWVDHLGDIKNGSSVCSDAYFAMIKKDFDAFEDPLVYTTGDNEWVDCHRANNGAYNPLERLAKLRELFFAHPGVTLGQHPARVRSQAELGLPEDVSWERADVAFAALDVQGSNNSLAPWTGLGRTAPTPEQTVEVLSRTSAVIVQIHETFERAKREHLRGVVLLQQADMFDPTVPNPQFADYYAFAPIVAAIAREAAAFRGPVYLFNGDSHVYNSDTPLAQGSPWLSFYGVTTPAPNLTRVTVDGSTGVNDYLRVTAHEHGPEVLTWEKVPFTAQPTP